MNNGTIVQCSACRDVMAATDFTIMNLVCLVVRHGCWVSRTVLTVRWTIQSRAFPLGVTFVQHVCGKNLTEGNAKCSNEKGSLIA